ncbi:type II CAAX prenyl endopeptidase Rce1 family protein [Deinococcus navajonensis]|uniref:Type II CAAX prenyl endopeptidase Rce1 family protein n=1 Tax=Deinococcus navajonensis TaxID=309884 RepID=A0ABV8XKJ6_9DEIO
MTAHAHQTPQRSLVIPALLTLLPLGAVGILALLPSLPASLAPILARLPDAPPLNVLLALQAAQLLVLSTLSVLLGAWLAPRLGLRSRLVDHDWAKLKDDLRHAALPGPLVGAGLVGADLLSAPDVGEAWASMQAQQERTPVVTLAGLLYGGLTEEPQLRWGVMSLLTFCLWKTLASGATHPPRQAVIGAVVLSALVFGALHLGAVAALVPLTPLLVVRTVVLNAAGGLVFGTLFARRSLETAMAAHAMAHLTMTALAWLLHL